MISEKDIIRISKFLSLVLRHNPGLIDINLDEQGWTDVETLLIKMNKKGKKIDFNTLNIVVKNNNKKRFAFNENKTKIRASQGHSIEINLGYNPQTPPEFLYHGSAEKFVGSILKTGIQKNGRHHVHLSADIKTALDVGKRHGKPVVFEISSQNMQKKGFLFYVSANNVWLTDNVPIEFIKLIEI